MAGCSWTPTCMWRGCPRCRPTGSPGLPLSGRTSRSASCTMPPGCPALPRLTRISPARVLTTCCCSLSTAPRPRAFSRSRTWRRWSSRTRRGSGPSPTSTRTCTTRSPPSWPDRSASARWRARFTLCTADSSPPTGCCIPPLRIRRNGACRSSCTAAPRRSLVRSTPSASLPCWTRSSVTSRR